MKVPQPFSFENYGKLRLWRVPRGKTLVFGDEPTDIENSSSNIRCPFAAHLIILGVWELFIGTVTPTEPLQQEFNVLELDATRCHPWSDR